MNRSIFIKTPRGQLVQSKGRGGKVTAKLEWNEGFGPQKTRDLKTAQEYVDSEVLRRSAPYMPIRTGTLIKSGQLGTVIGSGEVSYMAPYADQQYYNTAASRAYDAQRGAYWFERMKADQKDEILRGAKRIGGGHG